MNGGHFPNSFSEALASPDMVVGFERRSPTDELIRMIAAEDGITPDSGAYNMVGRAVERMLDVGGLDPEEMMMKLTVQGGEK